jgi:hypothetical protein
MMHLLALIGIPHALAQTLNGAGQGGAGVSDMWATICGVLPCTVGGTGGVGLVSYFSNRVIMFIWTLIGPTAVGMVIYAGIKVIMSEGKDEGREEAKKIIIYAAVGVILALISTAAIDFAQIFLRSSLQ